MGYEGNDRYRGQGYRQTMRGYGRDEGRGGPERHDRDRYDRDRYDRGRQERYGYGGGRFSSERERYGAPPPDYSYEDRGFFDRAGDEIRSWFGDEEAERRRRYDERYDMREEDRAYGRGYDSRSRWGREDRDREDWNRRERGRSYGAGGQSGLAGYGAAAGAGAAWSGGWRGREDHDPNYRAWRDRQLESFDRDYDEYRREHQSQFDQHFGDWRQTRQQQRQWVRQVQPHQEVVGSDGQHVGTVDAVKEDRIVLTRQDSEAGGHHHEIPCSWIARVADKVELNRTHDQAQAAWRDVEHGNDRSGRFGDDRGRDDNSGPHVLNRSFSGTY